MARTAARESRAELEAEAQDKFAELYAAEYPSVYRTVRGIVLDGAAAEDLTHEAFEKAMRAWEKLPDKGNSKAWLHRIAVNTAISHWRRQRLARLLPARLFVPGAGEAYDEIEDKSLVGAVMRPLTPQLRAVVVLHYYHEFSRDEIASLLEIPPGTVASRLAKAMQIMRRYAAVSGDRTEAHERLTK
ncbi:MAG TPA: sigma-70 family RNA polymerase sigma factor [Candidatus Dormibacteraeota bacterium]|jgi:RNA polymerase sigma-70 factor (ECF subfamily)|nr:sigma-70 family RNA polymerase sigma factor [Candidatus Dormibacteraeota bacterium]